MTKHGPVDVRPADAAAWTARRKAARSAEALLLYGLLPAAYALDWVSLPMLPVLWVCAAGCLVALLRDPSFNRRLLWNAAAVRPAFTRILAVFAVAAPLIVLGVWWFAPGLLFGFVLEKPLFWAIVMVLYPFLSVWPQNLVYRVFFFHRYGGLFPNNRIAVLAAAVAFSYLHIVFENPVAVVFTFFGGLLFAATYARTRSAAASTIEHALYGCLIFSVGLGQFFYGGAVR
jgi:uncharacterized protein